MGILNTVGEIAGAVAAVEGAEKLDPDAGLLTGGRRRRRLQGCGSDRRHAREEGRAAAAGRRHAGDGRQRHVAGMSMAAGPAAARPSRARRTGAAQPAGRACGRSVTHDTPGSWFDRREATSLAVFIGARRAAPCAARMPESCYRAVIRTAMRECDGFRLRPVRHRRRLGRVRLARMSASYGARVGIAEEEQIGGTCVRGCIPKKLLVYASHYPHEVEDAKGFGWTFGAGTLDWPALIAAKDREINRLSDIYINLLRQSGVEMHAGARRSSMRIRSRSATARSVRATSRSRPDRAVDAGAARHRACDHVARGARLPRAPSASRWSAAISRSSSRASSTASAATSTCSIAARRSCAASTTTCASS